MNGEKIFDKPGMESAEFLEALYKESDVEYPRFYKMDNLCKTAFITAELLLRTVPWKQGLQAEEAGIVLSNAHSSLDTDIRYEASLAQTPSPSLFVYTLPNVMIGELCIRHAVKGETACFVFDIFDAAFQTDYVNTLFETGKIKTCLSGWVDFYDGKAESFLYVAEKNKREKSNLHNASTINQIFQQNE